MSLIISGRDRLLISHAILDELLMVLARKFSRDLEELARVAVFFSDHAEVVRPRSRLHILAGDPDNRVLECSATGKADLLVTGDRAMLKLRRYGVTRIITLRDYLQHS